MIHFIHNGFVPPTLSILKMNQYELTCQVFVCFLDICILRTKKNKKEKREKYIDKINNVFLSI